MRRAEFGLFTVGEFAAADAAMQEVPWDTPDYAMGTGTDRHTDLLPLLQDGRRPEPFGGETMTLRNNTGGVPGVEECLEMGAAGWDDVTGTFEPQCPEPWTSDTRFTGITNHENDGAGQTIRKPEIGQRDNRTAIGVATIRTMPGGWDVPGYEWFQHKSGPIGCLMLRVILNWDLPLEASAEDRRLEVLGYTYGDIYNSPCAPGTDPALCESIHAAAKLAHVELAMQMFGWRLIASWRVQTLYNLWDVMREYEEIWGGRGRTLRARGRGPGTVQNNRCYTGPIGGDAYNERLAATGFDGVPAEEWMNPAWSGKTFWGSQMGLVSRICG